MPKIRKRPSAGLQTGRRDPCLQLSDGTDVVIQKPPRRIRGQVPSRP